MQLKITYDNTIKNYVNAYEMTSIPTEMTTAANYSQYLHYCIRHKQQARSKTKFTQELRKYGYVRVSARQFDGRIGKVYRYTGELPRTCEGCQGSGVVYG